jgi:hypothetical protein
MGQGSAILHREHRLPEGIKAYSSAELLAMLHESFRKGDELLIQLKKTLDA